MKKMRQFLMILMLATFTLSCSEDTEPSKKVEPEKAQLQPAKSKEQSNGRVAYSNPGVIEQLVSLGYVVDVNDAEHYSNYIGGTYEITIHFRGDTVYDDKYTITYESTGHVGEEVMFKGYIANVGVLSTLLDAFQIGALQ
jgi:hypothetical protein